MSKDNYETVLGIKKRRRVSRKDKMEEKQKERLAEKCLEADGTRFSKELELGNIIIKECIIKNDECKYTRFIFNKYLCIYS